MNPIRKKIREEMEKISSSFIIPKNTSLSIVGVEHAQVLQSDTKVFFYIKTTDLREDNKGFDVDFVVNKVTSTITYQDQDNQTQTIQFDSDNMKNLTRNHIKISPELRVNQVLFEFDPNKKELFIDVY